ncbi:MAG TPA: hypothetical protein VLF64_03395, partial [Candidatus Saccharimonadales bacterium]|nr:hypothetical protein [Candidatus Saccharimonadales bacterium]
GVITTLPAGFRPNKQIIFTTISSGSNAIARVDVFPDGTVMWQGGGDNSWVSLDGINFMSSDFDASTNWVNPTLLCPSGCTTPWTDFSGGSTSYGRLQIGKDSIGRAQLYGILSAPSPYPPANNSNMATLASAYSVSTNDIYPDFASSNVYAAYGIISNALQFRTNLGNNWKTFAAMYYPSGSSATWTSIPLSSSWVPYNTAGSGYSQPQFTESTDHIVTLRGLIRSGTASAGTTVGTLPAGAHPATNLIFIVSGYNGTAEIPVRVDVLATGQIVIRTTIANNYLSFANISFYQDGN